MIDKQTTTSMPDPSKAIRLPGNAKAVSTSTAKGMTKANDYYAAQQKALRLERRLKREERRILREEAIEEIGGMEEGDSDIAVEARLSNYENAMGRDDDHNTKFN